MLFAAVAMRKACLHALPVPVPSCSRQAFEPPARSRSLILAAAAATARAASRVRRLICDRGGPSEEDDAILDPELRPFPKERDTKTHELWRVGHEAAFQAGGVEGVLGADWSPTSILLAQGEKPRRKMSVFFDEHQITRPRYSRVENECTVKRPLFHENADRPRFILVDRGKCLPPILFCGMYGKIRQSVFFKSLLLVRTWQQKLVGGPGPIAVFINRTSCCINQGPGRDKMKEQQ